MNDDSPQSPVPDQGEASPLLLIVDDSRLMRVAIGKLLRKDYLLVEAVDGEDAWEKLSAHEEIQGVFSDLLMPRLDGFGLLERMRNASEDRLRQMPFVLITGKDGSEQTLLNEVRKRGGNNVIGKPFTASEVKDRAKEMLTAAAFPDAAKEQAQREAEEQARRAAEEQARRAAEEQARREAEEQARRAAEEQARRAAEEQARREAEEQARRAAEEQARRAAEEQARRAAEEQARREAEEQARREAAEQDEPASEEEPRREEQERATREAWARARRTAEEWARSEAEQQVDRFSPAKAFVVRLALPWLRLSNLLLRIPTEERIEALKRRLPPR